MSLEKLAKVLHVDEVELMHGPKGVAVRVRIEKAWHVSLIDNEDLGKRRLEVIAEHLGHLADANIHKVRDSLRKSTAAFDVATQAALRADADMVRRRSEMLSWRDVSWEMPTDGAVQYQAQRVEPMRTPQTPLIDPPLASAVSEPMQSRFHAIIAELRDL